MNANHYLNDDENEKCQCITFDENGKIMGSCDTLFATGRLSVAKIKKEFPFLWKMISYLKSHKDDPNPLFYPDIEFEYNGYRSVCDFTFMQSEDALGIKRFICMIYDNSIHYKHLIKSGLTGKMKRHKLHI